MKKKLLAVLSLSILLILSGCGEKEKPSQPMPTGTSAASSVATKEYDAAKEPPAAAGVAKPVARLRTEGYDSYQDVTFKKENTYTPPSRFGYKFEGYQDNSGVTYIDSKGKAIRDYNGADTLVLWAQFTPEEYSFVFYDGGVEQPQFNEITCKFNNSISANLPIGETLADKQGRTCVVTGLTFNDGTTVATYKDPQLCPKDFFTGAEIPGSTIELQMITTPLTYVEPRGMALEVDNGKFAEQNLDGNGLKVEAFSLRDDGIDVEALKALGYKNVVMQFECVLGDSKNMPHIAILSSMPENEKDIKSFTVYDSKKDKSEMDEDGATFKCNEGDQQKLVNINDIQDTIYVAYKMDALFKSTCTLGARTLEVTFTK